MNATKPVMAPEYPGDPSDEDLIKQWSTERQENIKKLADLAPVRKQPEPLTSERALAQMALFGVDTKKLLAAHAQSSSVQPELNPVQPELSSLQPEHEWPEPLADVPVVHIPVRQGPRRAAERIHISVSE